MFITPHRTEILILFPIYRHLNVEKKNLWKKRDIANGDPLGSLHSSLGFQEPVNSSASYHQT